MSFDLFYGTPSAGKRQGGGAPCQEPLQHHPPAALQPRTNKRSLDLCAFINGLPVITFELKNSLTKQTVEDAVEQYKRDRDPRETLFAFGRCVVHFAVDDHEVRDVHRTQGQEGHGQGFVVSALQSRAGTMARAIRPTRTASRPITCGSASSPRRGLTEILENYAQIVGGSEPEDRQEEAVQIFPRYHQLDVVRSSSPDVLQHGAGKRYLIQHSAGSGKSNSIAWLAHQLIGLRKDGKEVFDSIIVITDRRLLDQQIRETIKWLCPGRQHHRRGEGRRGQLQDRAAGEVPQGRQEDHHLHRADLSLRARQHRRSSASRRRFAIIIDEAHSSQGGRTTAAMNMACRKGRSSEDEITEDKINRIIEAQAARPTPATLPSRLRPRTRRWRCSACRM
jgi:type I restriction enzyme R subunit